MKKLLTATLLILSVFLLIKTQTNAQISTGLVGYWTFDEGSGNTAGDSAGSNTGTLINGPSWATGANAKIGSGALNFDGVDDYVKVTGSSLVAPYSISVWFKPSQLGVNQDLFSLSHVNSGQTHLYLSDNNNNASTNSRLVYVDSSTRFLYGTKVFTSSDLNKWWHVVVTIPSSDVSTWNIYLNSAVDNGSLSNSGTYNGPGTSIYMGSNVDFLYKFNGSLDDFRIYNRALSSAEVSQLYTYTYTNPVVPVTPPVEQPPVVPVTPVTPTSGIYYIDFQNGNDANTGLTPGTAWKNIPGTMSNCDTSNPIWTQTIWGGGTIQVGNNNKRVQPGTIFKLKPGTTYSATKGCIWIYNYFYADGTVSNPIRFELDTNQGPGTVTFDGAGSGITSATAISVILIQVDGVQFDGKIAKGITMKNSPITGIEVKERPSGAAIKDCSFKYMFFYNNGTSFPNDLAGSGSGQLLLRKIDGCIVDNVEFDGAKSVLPLHYINGFLAGENHMTALRLLVSNSVSHDHLGDPVDNDSGIGFKIQNGQAVLINNTSYNNLKGFDLGEEHSDGADIIYKVINALVYNNNWGVNFSNNPYDVGVHTANWYVINSIIRNNQEGTNAYSGPYNLYLIHNVYANNGIANQVNPWDAWNFRVGPDGCQDQTPINAHFYNNIFYKPFGYSNYFNTYIGDGTPGNDTNFSLHSDYNSWVQNATEYFSYLAGYNCTNRATPPNIQYEHSYGADGPGHASGLWYTTEDEPANGTGHIGSDSHSKGTGSSDPTLPPFTDPTAKNYTLTAPYSGLNLSSQPWYIPEMGVDRTGRTRTNWDIGAYEYTGVITPPTPIIGDFNNDRLVNSLDFSLLVSAWNQNNATYDINHDGIINSLDYVVMVQNWTQ